MPESKKGHKPNHSIDNKNNSEIATALSNTAENAIKAAQTARSFLANLGPGQVWNHTTPKGAKEIKGSLDHNKQPFVMLRFSPADGSLLPKGLHGLSQSSPETMAKVKERLQQITNELVVLDGAEFREPECCWAIPLAHQGRIVAHLKISADGSETIPDHKAIEELNKSKQ